MRVKSKKKLALLVSMALTIGSTLAVNPMDVYAASITWDADSNKYNVTVGDTVTPVDQASDAIKKIIEGLKTDADKNITIDLSDKSTWQKDADSIKAAKNLAAALRGQDVTLQSGADVKLTFANGDAYTFANGEGDSTVNLGSDSVLKVDGNITTVTAKIDGNRPAKIDVAEGKTVGTITVNDGTKGTLALTGKGTVSKLDAQGDITVSATDTTLKEIAVAADKTLTTTGDIKAGSISGNGNVSAGGALNVAGDINVASVTATGALTATNIETTGKITADNVTAGTVKAGSVDADVKANSLELNSVVKVDGSKTWDVGTLKTGGNLTVSDASKLTANSIVSAGDLEISDTANTLRVTNITSTGKMTIANAENVAPDTNITAQNGLTVTAGNLNAGNLSVNGELTVTAGESTTITADSIEFGKNATIGSEKANIKANAVTIDTTAMDADNIKKLNITPKNDGGAVNVKVVTKDGSLSDELKDAIKQAAGDDVTISATSEDAQKAQAKADEAIAKADEELGKVNEFAAKDAAEIAQANPFITKLPSASDIAAVASPTKDQLNDLTTAKDGLNSAINDLNTQIEAAKTANNEPLQKDLEAKKAELQSKLNNVSSAEGMQAKAAELTAAVQQAGKTAAAPGVASARTATVVTNVMTANVTGRTSELRGFASAVDEGRPAPDNVWFQYKHTNMDVDNGDVYGKSTVKTNNYQLGYDAKVGPNDYLGAYIGTTTGNVEFNAPAVTDRTDIDNAYDFGIYGTHMLPSDQYIDYMIHTGKFDSKYKGVTWGTKDTGAMIGYGAKIAQNDRLTWNPYIQLAYDKVSVDSYMAGANYIASDDSNNWTAKLGINLLDVSGFYGGLAYSRGLSGSYNAYINGVPMPSQDNNANVLYMSLGYRANMSRNVFLDLSMEKTFADYNGWTAAGKVNFYF